MIRKNIYFSFSKRIAKQRDIPLSSIKGSGPHGRILKIDIDNFDIKKIEYPSLII